MPNVEDIRRTVTESTPVRAAVGATDLAVERVRTVVAHRAETQAKLEERLTKVQHSVEKAVSDFDAKALQAKAREALDPKALQAAAQQVPALAVSRALEVASRAEARYESLAERGKVLIERLRGQKATQDLISQGKVTISRTKAAVTTARKAVDETAGAALDAVGIGRREVAETAETVEQAVAEGEERIRKAAASAGASAGKRAASARTAAKGAGTSARKTATKAAKAARDAADTIGE